MRKGRWLSWLHVLVERCSPPSVPFPVPDSVSDSESGTALGTRKGTGWSEYCTQTTYRAPPPAAPAPAPPLVVAEPPAGRMPSEPALLRWMVWPAGIAEMLTWLGSWISTWNDRPRGPAYACMYFCTALARFLSSSSRTWVNLSGFATS